MNRSSYTLEKVQMQSGFTSAAVLNNKTKTPTQLLMRGKFTSELYNDDYYKGDRKIVYFKPDAAAVTELRKIFEVVTNARELETREWTMKPIFSKDETVRLKLKFETCGEVSVPKGFTSNNDKAVQEPKGLKAEVVVAVSTYYNAENNTLGLFFTVNEINF